jgi:hypothetical protein
LPDFNAHHYRSCNAGGLAAIGFRALCDTPPDARDRSRAVAELVALHANLLQQGQVEISDRGTLRQHDMLAAELHPAGAAAHYDIRLRIVIVQVAVAHVRPVHENRVIEQRALAIRRALQLCIICIIPKKALDAITAAARVQNAGYPSRHAFCAMAQAI